MMLVEGIEFVDCEQKELIGEESQLYVSDPVD
jgi:hypothetical protein